MRAARACMRMVRAVHALRGAAAAAAADAAVGWWLAAAAAFAAGGAACGRRRVARWSDYVCIIYLHGHIFALKHA
jgi:hypothetical protein